MKEKSSKFNLKRREEFLNSCTLMSLDKLLNTSHLSHPCRGDIDRLRREYDSVSPSMQRSSASRRFDGTGASAPRHTPCSCLPLTPAVRHGNYKVSPTFSPKQERMQGSRTEPRALSALPRSIENDAFRLKFANSNFAQRVQNAVDAHTGTDAHKAYTAAFLSFTGRMPNPKELREVDRLRFATDPVTGRPVITDTCSEAAWYYYLKRSHHKSTAPNGAFRRTMCAGTTM